MKAIRVQFKETGKRYYFSPGNIDVANGDMVVVSTIRGIEIGKVNGDITEINQKDLESELKEIIRKANDKDLENYNKNRNKLLKLFVQQSNMFCV